MTKYIICAGFDINGALELRYTGIRNNAVAMVRLAKRFNTRTEAEAALMGFNSTWRERAFVREINEQEDEETEHNSPSVRQEGSLTIGWEEFLRQDTSAARTLLQTSGEARRYLPARGNSSISQGSWHSASAGYNEVRSERAAIASSPVQSLPTGDQEV